MENKNYGSFEDYEKSHCSLETSLRTGLDEIVSFSGTYKNYCVCIVDVVNSTKITATLPREKMCKYYSIFLNAMALIAKEFGASVVKIIGDSMLYYFPETSDVYKKLSFADSLECGMAMIDAHRIINTKMSEERLPHVDYRISADYGSIMTAKSVTSLNDDVFGSSVNICAKINSLAESNGMVIGGDLYQIVKSFIGYDFKPVTDCSIGLKLQYPVYSITRHVE